MDKLLKQVRIVRGSPRAIEEEVNDWLADRANEKYDYDITYVPASDYYLIVIITYWEANDE